MGTDVADYQFPVLAMRASDDTFVAEMRSANRETEVYVREDPAE
jgi:hypothetical protein